MWVWGFLVRGSWVGVSWGGGFEVLLYLLLLLLLLLVVIGGGGGDVAGEDGIGIGMLRRGCV